MGKVYMTDLKTALKVLREVDRDVRHPVNNPTHRRHHEARRAFYRVVMQINDPAQQHVGEIDMRRMNPDLTNELRRKFRSTKIVPETKPGLEFEAF